MIGDDVIRDLVLGMVDQNEEFEGNYNRVHGTCKYCRRSDRKHKDWCPVLIFRCVIESHLEGKQCLIPIVYTRENGWGRILKQMARDLETNWYNLIDEPHEFSCQWCLVGVHGQLGGDPGHDDDCPMGVIRQAIANALGTKEEHAGDQ